MAIVELAESADLTCCELAHELRIRGAGSIELGRGFADACHQGVPTRAPREKPTQNWGKSADEGSGLACAKPSSPSTPTKVRKTDRGRKLSRAPRSKRGTGPEPVSDS